MSSDLRGSVMRRWDDEAGVHAAVELIEPNGDTYEVEWLLRPDGMVDIGAQEDVLPYLQERYGPETFFHVVTTLSMG